MQCLLMTWRYPKLKQRNKKLDSSETVVCAVKEFCHKKGKNSSSNLRTWEEISYSTG